MLGYKWRHSFLFSIFGEALYTYWAFAEGLIELGTICIVFCLIAFRNWWKWRELNPVEKLYEMLHQAEADIKTGRLHSHEDVKRELS